MIKSTVSGGTSVTPSAPAAKSTRQRGVKHSITKRFTRGARREVRLPSLRPRSASSATRRIVEPQVAEVLADRIPNRSAGLRSWPKNTVQGLEARKRRRGVRRVAFTGSRNGWCQGSIPADIPWPERVRPVCGARPPAVDPMRPRNAPVRRGVQRVGGMALRSRRRSGILLGTRDTRPARSPPLLCRRAPRPYSGESGTGSGELAQNGRSGGPTRTHRPVRCSARQRRPRRESASWPVMTSPSPPIAGRSPNRRRCPSRPQR
jgi:hypothetical protein